MGMHLDPDVIFDLEHTLWRGGPSSSIQMDSTINNTNISWEDKNELLRSSFRARQRDVTHMLAPKTLTRIKALFDEYEEQGGIRLPAFCELMERVLGAFVASRVDFFC